jgi:hypothetical protein
LSGFWLQDFICVAFGYQQQELLHKLLATALTNGLRPQDPNTPGSSVAGCSNSLLATAAVLDAVARLHQSPGAGTLWSTSSKLQAYSQFPHQCVVRLPAELHLPV